MHPNGDPGGIEGVFPIQYLARLEKKQKQTKKQQPRTPELGGAFPVAARGADWWAVGCPLFFPLRKHQTSLATQSTNTKTPGLPKGVRLDHPRNRVVVYRESPISPPQSYQMTQATRSTMHWPARDHELSLPRTICIPFASGGISSFD